MSLISECIISGIILLDRKYITRLVPRQKLLYSYPPPKTHGFYQILRHSGTLSEISTASKYCKREEAKCSYAAVSRQDEKQLFGPCDYLKISNKILTVGNSSLPFIINAHVGISSSSDSARQVSVKFACYYNQITKLSPYLTFFLHLMEHSYILQRKTEDNNRQRNVTVHVLELRIKVQVFKLNTVFFILLLLQTHWVNISVANQFQGLLCSPFS